MARSSCEVRTEGAALQMRKLCKHFAHRVTAGWSEEKGRIVFPFGSIDLLAEGDRLAITVRTAETDRLAELEDVVARHLERFAFRETIAFDWRRDDAVA